MALTHLVATLHNGAPRERTGFGGPAALDRAAPLRAARSGDKLLWKFPASDAPVGLGEINSPGLWKKVGDEAVFEIPWAIVEGADRGLTGADQGSDDETSSLAALLTEVTGWAEATRRGKTPSGWNAPDVASPAADVRTIRVGGLLAMIEFTCAADHLALEAVLVSQVSPTLSPARRARLESFVEHANRRWKLARLGFRRRGAAEQIVAEIELSGCPSWLAEKLVPAAADALRQLVANLLLSVRAFSDPQVVCGLWDSPQAAG